MKKLPILVVKKNQFLSLDQIATLGAAGYYSWDFLEIPETGFNRMETRMASRRLELAIMKGKDVIFVECNPDLMAGLYRHQGELHSRYHELLVTETGRVMHFTNYGQGEVLE